MITLRRLTLLCLTLLALILVLACGLPMPPDRQATPTLLTATPTAGPTAAPTRTPTPEATATPMPPLTPRPTYTPTPRPSPTPALVRDPQLNAASIDLFPWPLYRGDTVSVDVDALIPDDVAVADVEEMSVTVTLSTGETSTEPLVRAGLDREPQARFYWVDELSPIVRTLVVTATLSVPETVADPNPSNNVAVVEVPVLSPHTLPPPEPRARWAVTETAGFRLHYVTGSAAERDLPELLSTAEAAHADVTTRLDATTEEPVDIYLLDRVIGQGGYASSDWVAVTYTDRRYMPVEPGSVLRHELVHRLDDAIGCDRAPAALREGLAVYVTGGHYRSEPLREKAAALLATTHYVPLARVVEDFYTHQHEVAYLEIGALLAYVDERYGWEALGAMCAAAADARGDGADAWEAAVAELGVADLQALEREWQAWLRAAPTSTAATRLLDLELELMDAMRRYQAAYDVPAHFLEGLLLSPEEAARRDIVADFVRRPRAPEPIALELLLAMAQEAVDQSNPTLLALLLDEIAVALDAGPAASQLANDLLEITRLALAQGYEPYRVELEGDDRYLVYLLDRRRWPDQVQVTAGRNGAAGEDGWHLSEARAVE